MVGRVVPWVERAIWWHVYPLGFTGAERAALPPGEPVRHRLRHLARWLDYAVELGCNGLLLGPIFAAETHGYDTVDHFRIDPRLGDDEDFDALVAAARARGVRIALDGVFNHVGRGFPAFAAAEAALAAGAGGPGTPAARWFKRDPKTGDFAVFEGHGHLVELDHDQQAVISYVTDVTRYWLARGAAGWRLDAAYAVPARFWARVLPAVRETFPDAWFSGEMIHGDYAAYAAEAGLDSVTQYETWKAIWSSLSDRNFYELDHALGRHNWFCDRGLLPQTFVGNHDVTRLATALDDERHVGHAVAVLFCIAGMPSVYYGDEQAFRGLKEHRAGGDDEIRPKFPASPRELAPYGWPTYRLHQRLIGFRRRHPWLVTARTATEHLSNTAMAIRLVPSAGTASAGGADQALLLLNTGDDQVKFPVDPGELDVAVIPDPADPPPDPLIVAPHSWTILA
ncbi:MAG TPA: alpha-amylase family protein [Trebonia sp.]|jgi:glycosidase|nr:alpha-amylase family protein [Trebonia sp.]